MAFTPIPRPPRNTGDGERDRFELTKWYDAVWKSLSGIASVAWRSIDFDTSKLSDIAERPHDALTDVLQADDTSASTTTEKHVTDALVKKYNDHILLTDANPHGVDHAYLDNVLQSDDTDTSTDTEKHVTNAQVKKYEDHRLASTDVHGIGAASAVVGTNTVQILTKKSFGITPDYATFEDDGTLVFNGAATIWKDIDFPIIIRTTGADKPVLTTVQGNLTMPLWLVDDYNICETQELIHEWKEGSTGYMHCHILTSAAQATNAYTSWEVEYLVLPESGTMAATNTTVASGDVLIPAGTPAGTHFLVPIHIIDLTGYNIADHIKTRLKRVAATGAAPTGNVYCEMLQMHIECDTVGSRGVSTK